MSLRLLSIIIIHACHDVLEGEENFLSYASWKENKRERERKWRKKDGREMEARKEEEGDDSCGKDVGEEARQQNDKN